MVVAIPQKFLHQSFTACPRGRLRALACDRLAEVGGSGPQVRCLPHFSVRRTDYARSESSANHSGAWLANL
jgi:hypothetical protein